MKADNNTNAGAGASMPVGTVPCYIVPVKKPLLRRLGKIFTSALFYNNTRRLRTVILHHRLGFYAD
jgi:hypothetical protein